MHEPGGSHAILKKGDETTEIEYGLNTVVHRQVLTILARGGSAVN